MEEVVCNASERVISCRTQGSQRATGSRIAQGQELVR